MIPTGTLCIIIRTRFAHLLGRPCTVIGYAPYGRSDHLFEMSDGAVYSGGRHNVIPVAPPEPARHTPSRVIEA